MESEDEPPKMMEQISKGGFFGEAAMLSGGVSDTSVRTLEDCAVLVFAQVLGTSWPLAVGTSWPRTDRTARG